MARRSKRPVAEKQAEMRARLLGLIPRECYACEQVAAVQVRKDKGRAVYQCRECQHVFREDGVGLMRTRRWKTPPDPNVFGIRDDVYRVYRRDLFPRGFGRGRRTRAAAGCL